MSRRTIVISGLAVLILAATIACGALPASIQAFGGSSQPQTAQQPTTQQQSSNTPLAAPIVPAVSAQSAPVQVTGPLAQYESTLIGVYQNVIPSVVQIQTDQGEGSGFVWDTNGNIVTNNHVVAGASQIEVNFADGGSFPAKVVGTDVNADLAVINVNAQGETLKPVQLADSTKVQVGQIAIAIGDPFGLDGSMSLGIISGLGRDLAVDTSSSDANGNGNGNNSGNSAGYTIPDIIQTDAPINPGNSGGVLVDDSGHLIGVTAAIASPVRANSGVGFVIPSVIVNKVVPALISTGHYDHTWLGISGGTLTPDAANKLGLAANQHGAVVMDVLANGPAGKAGLKSGDVIISIDNQAVARFDDLTIYMARNTDVGQTVTMTVLRDGKQMTVKVVLEARPAQ